MTDTSKTDYGRPTLVELVGAVREFLDSEVRAATEGQVNFHARVASNVLKIVWRELAERGSSERPFSTERGSSERPFSAVDEKALVAAITDGEFDGRDDEVLTFLRTIVYERLSVNNPGYAVQSVADRLFAAIAAGEVQTVESMWSDDVQVWHAGDTRPSDKARAMRVIDWFVSVTEEREYNVFDRQYFTDGFVQQHVLRGTTRDGTAYALRVGIIIRVGPDGLITRIDEYFDPADLAPLTKETE